MVVVVVVVVIVVVAVVIFAGLGGSRRVDSGPHTRRFVARESE